jgi:hypothetical protein
MYTPFKMKGKSPMMKKLIGNQHRLPEHLKAKIEAAPESPTKMKKESATKMKKASMTKMKKESMAKLKKSATKLKKSAAKKKPNKFSAEYRKMTPSQRRRVYGEKVTGSKAQTDKKRAEGKAKVKSKLSKDIGSVTSRLDKAIQSFFNNPRAKQRGKGDVYEPQGDVKKTTPKKQSSNKGGFTSRKGDPYLYRKNNDGTFTTKKGEGGKEITVKKGSKGYDAISSVFKLKKKSAAKMKKSPAKLIKKKTDREKLNKLVEKRTKLNKRKDERKAKGKKTKRVTRRIEKVQNKINKNPKAQEDRKNSKKRKNVDPDTGKTYENLRKVITKTPTGRVINRVRMALEGGKKKK